MSRAHLFYNPNVYKKAAEIANNFVEHMKKPVVILVEELEQFKKLQPHLRGRYSFAHGPLTKDTKKLVPEEFQATNSKELVAKFNKGEIDILVGTSCIATGTDILPAEAVIYLMGGKSEIKIKQGIGRGTRGGIKGTVFNPWTGIQKTSVIVVDFDVEDGVTVHRHAEARYKIYKDAYAEPKRIR
jgi:superfamily II DNA or RNA helicase